LTRHNDPIDEPAAWMTTVATRLSINVLKSARVRLTIRGVTRTVTGSGHYASPRPASFGEVAGLQLRTSFDRREFGFEWQMELPGGGDAVGWEVEVDIDLLLIRADTA
jgi:polyisoprenoid-binding protein YceI